ncbi:hypothetical protein CQ393_04060 [Stenotrophomonas sp. MYb238]|uniref:hypothetical protein n=1 Tax=Stenotrophomonas sp. MYb238 TaxID=2040281 RepID=UPI0012913480|nr:hypothetical protein [Stenotrophomonas sp. MYb238]MQP75069.1 hypothetical protein [Stenotrophomonas sp. MYb238]
MNLPSPGIQMGSWMVVRSSGIQPERLATGLEVNLTALSNRRQKISLVCFNLLMNKGNGDFALPQNIAGSHRAG